MGKIIFTSFYILFFYIFPGIVNSEGSLWKSQRRYLINQKLGLRAHSMSGTASEQIESRVRQEVFDFLQNIQSYQLQPLNPANVINSAVANVICTMLMSVRFRHDDEKFQRFMFLFDEGFRLFNDTGAMTFIPFFKHLPGVKATCQKLRGNRNEMLKFVKDIISQHKEELNNNSPRDLMDSYLIKIEELRQEDKLDEFFHGFDPETQLEQIVLDLFSAGVETIKTSLLWSIVHMIRNPEVKHKVQEELDRVVGGNRLPELADMKSLPYTRAVLYEVLRRTTVVPCATTHATNR